MIVNVAGMNADVAEKDFSFGISAAEADIFVEGVDFADDVSVVGTVAFTGRGYRIRGKIVCEKTFECARCLEKTTRREEYSFDEDFFRDKADDADANVFSGDGIDIAALVRDTVIASQSTADLCRDDCRGLCPKCGKNLNDGDCGCDLFSADPRLAVLQNFIKNDE